MCVGCQLVTAPNGPSQCSVIQNALRRAMNLIPMDILALQLHGTGTALGDPIEVGAGVGALRPEPSQHSQSVQSPRTLTLLAVKSVAGHAESAAGLVGVVESNRSLTSFSFADLRHLIAVNPYVAQTLPSNVSLPILMGKAQGVLALEKIVDEHKMACMGISSFAFQGTNAHTVLAYSYYSSWYGVQQNAARTQRHQQFWAGSTSHAVLQMCTPILGSAMEIHFTGSLPHSARLASIWDHQVNNRAVFPGAGFLEMTSAAFVIHSSLIQNTGRHCSLVSVSIPVPLILSLLATVDVSPNSRSSTISCKVQTLVGSFMIESASTNQQHAKLHAAGSLGILPTSMTMITSLNQFICKQSHQQALCSLLSSTETKVVIMIHSKVSPIETYQATGYLMHPAVLDADLQLGAGVPYINGKMRLPSGIGAFCLDCAGSARLPLVSHAIAVISSPISESSPSYSLHSHLSSAGVTQAGIRDLVCKVGHREATSQSMPKISQDHMCMYQVEDVAMSGQSEENTMLTLKPKTILRPHCISFCRDSSMNTPRNFAARSLHVHLLGILPCMQHMFPSVEFQQVHILTIGAAEKSSCCGSTGNTTADASASLWGLLRTAAAEMTEGIKCSGQHSEAFGFKPGVDNSEVLHQQVDVWCRLTSSQGRCHTHHLVQSSAMPGCGNMQLVPSPRGSLNSLVVSSSTLDVEQVPVQEQGKSFWMKVQAVGVNFRDVLNVLGLYPGDPGMPGLDCAAVGTAPHSHLADHSPLRRDAAGIAYFGFAIGCLGSSVFASNTQMAVKPGTLTFEKASSCPTIFTTVHCAFNQMPSHHARGSHVLVHAGMPVVRLLSLADS